MPTPCVSNTMEDINIPSEIHKYTSLSEKVLVDVVLYDHKLVRWAKLGGNYGMWVLFDPFFMFSNFQQLGFGNKTCVP